MTDTAAKRQFPFELPAHTFTEDPAEKWRRQHEQRRLKAYLQGKERFAHGREMSLNGFVPVMYYVTPPAPAK